MEELHSWIDETFQFRVLLLATEEARETVHAINLELAELFDPFGQLTQSFSFKALGTTKQVRSVTVRFVDTLARRPDPELAEEWAPPVDWAAAFVQSPADAPSYLATRPTPWYSQWQQAFIEGQRYADHELIDMPVAMVIVASTNDTDPIARLNTLNQLKALPPQYTRAAFDSDVPKVFLLLHDVSRSDLRQSAVEQLFSKMQSALYPNFCRWFQVNSGADCEGLWGPHKATRVSTKDVHNIQTFVSELVPRVIIPHCADRINRLHSLIEKRRKSFRNSLKNLFKKSADKTERFSFTTGKLEHAYRYLADLHFLCRDYSAALEFYKAAAGALRTAKAFKHTAAASEMQALCMAALGAEFSEVQSLLDTAYGFYQKAEDNYMLCRSAIYTQILYSYYGESRSVANRLVATGSIAKNVPLVSALFLEQTAHCFLAMEPPKLRKFAFYEVLAGNEYRENNLSAHGLRCYLAAWQVYKDKGWEHIALHMKNMLGRFCYHLNLDLEAAHFFLELVQCKSLLTCPDFYQKKVLNELLAPISRWTADSNKSLVNPITQAVVPLLADGKALFPFSKPDLQSFNVVLFEDTIVSSGTDFTWHSFMTSPATGMALQGEDIQITLTFFNPLELLLIIEDVHLMAEYSNEEVPEVETVESLELQPKSSCNTTLSLNPKKPGQLRINGICWTFAKTFHAYCALTQTFTVQPPHPALTLSVLQCPQNLLLGETATLSFKLSNNSAEDIRNVRLQVSSPQMLGFQEKTLNDLLSGSSRDISFVVRGAEVGTCDIGFAFFYESLELTRLSRAEIRVEVTEFLRLSARVEHSIKDPGDNVLILAVQAITDTAYSVTKVLPCSNHSLKFITDIEGENYYFNIKEDNTAEKPCAEHWAFYERSKSHAEGIDIAICWETTVDGSQRKGIHFMCDVEFFDEFVSLPVHIVIDCPTRVTHDFAAEFYLKLPVEVHLKSILTEPFEFNLEALPSQLVRREQPHFQWAGVTRQRVILEPGRLHSFQLQAVFTSTGSYNLNTFTISLPGSKTGHMIGYQHWLLIN